MGFKKGLFYFVLVVFLINTVLGAVPVTKVFAQRNEKGTEQRLIEEILILDTRVLALRKEIEKLSAENQELKQELLKMQKELTSLDSDVRLRQNQLSSWIVFSFKGGIGNMLTVLVGAEDLSEFFRRFDNIMFFLEYYNNIIIETQALITQRKQEEKSMMEKHQEIQNLEEQAKMALDKITQTIAEKQKELRRARLILKDITFLEEISENWQESLPSLDYLLKNLSSLPWSSLKPDDLKVNYFAMTAQAEFWDTSITKTLLSGDEKLKNVYFTFDSEGITVTEKSEGTTPIYSITCSMELTDDQKIQFTPKRLDFNGVTLPPKVIDELMTDYDMVFTPPPLPYDLKITSISTQKGKLIMNFKK